MSKIILLTGSTGFVGSHVLRRLINLGISVRVVIRDGKHEQLKNIKGVESIIITSDLFKEDSQWYINVCKGIDTVVHVAWYSEPGEYLLSSKNLDCLSGTLKLAQGAVDAGVRRFIGIGSCFEYDLCGGHITIKTPLLPKTPYASAKAAAYIALSQWFPLQSIEFAWCRLFYLYGEGEDARRLVPYLRSKLKNGETAELTSGNQIRDYLDISEASNEITKVITGEVLGAVNICSGIPQTVRQLAEKIANEYGRIDLLKFGARKNNSFDPPFVVGFKSLE